MSHRQVLLLLGALASIMASNAVAQARGQKLAPAEAKSSASSSAEASSYSVAPMGTGTNRDMMYRRMWGIDNLKTLWTSSGALIRFSYRVVDASKAQRLNDKELQPRLVDESRGVMLQVPEVEQVGQLRQVATPQNGREYWMVFSNRGGYVRPGDHVDVVIGSFHVDGLVVEHPAGTRPMTPSSAQK